MTRPLRVVTEQPWRAEAACRGMNPEIFYPGQGGWSEHGPHGSVMLGQIAAAKAVCAGCPAREACLDYAMDAHEPEGIFGGLAPRERYRLRRRERGAAS